MVKKNKGFTLVELLATIVILGILAAVSMPTVLNLLSKNTKKVYVNDAIKLISQAEYKVRAASTNIQKPNDGDCIVMSLIYLNNSDFDNPPNKGEYIKGASYVVIKNNGGNLEYAATIVEKMKNGGFRGVKLATSDELSGKNSNKYVVDFKKTDLIYVDTDSVDENNSTILTSDIINKNLGNNYVSKINNVYSYPDLGEDVVDEKAMAPRITRVSLSSASGKEYYSLDARLSMSVVDKDTPKSRLKVRYYFSFNNEVGAFPNISDSCSNSGNDIRRKGCFDWGIADAFTKDFDFNNYAYDGKNKLTYEKNNKISIYIVVSDPEGNFDRQQVDYDIHENTSPLIRSVKISKLPSDSQNLASTQVNLDVTDDIDDIKDLKICLTQNNSCTDSEYKTYSSMFDANKNTYYTFKCNNSICLPKGQKLKLNVFVKDKFGKVSSSSADYTLYNNKAPVIDVGIKLVPGTDKFKSVANYYCPTSDSSCLDKFNKNSLSYYLVMDNDSQIKDDLSSNSKITLTLQEVNSSGKKIGEAKSITYDKYLSSTDFGGRFLGKYDGANRFLKLIATDEYGESNSKTFEYKNVYKNQPPVLVKSESKISSTGCPSKISSYCNSDDTSSGNINTKIKLNIVDDIDDESNITVKTYDKDYKDDVESEKYSISGFADGTKTFKFKSKDSSKPYATDSNNGKRTYMITMIDSDNQESTGSLNYTIYQNKPPIILDTSVENVGGSPLYDVNDTDYYLDGNRLSSVIKVTLTDDLDGDSQVNVAVKDILNDNKLSKASKYSDIKNSGIKYTFAGKYDGVDRKYRAVATDSYGASSESEETTYYNIYKNVAATVENLTVTGANKQPCNNAGLCSDDGDGGSLDAVVKFNVRDDLDAPTNVLYCVATGDNKCIPNIKYTSDIATKGITIKAASKYFNEPQPEEPSDDFNLDNNITGDTSSSKDSTNNASTENYNILAQDAEQTDPSEVKVNVYLLDTYSENSDSLYYYHVYKNKAPVFSNNTNFESNDIRNQSIIKGSFSVEDDFDSNELEWQFCYKDSAKKEKCFSKVPVPSSKEFKMNIEFTADLGIAPDEFKAQEYILYVRVYDSGGLMSTTLKSSYQVDASAYPELTENTTAYAIGTTKYNYSNNLSQNFTDTVNNKTYLCSGYYKVYEISYKKVSLGGDDSNNYMIVRDKVKEIENNKYCAEAVDATDGPYLFKYGVEPHKSPYARYDDSNGGK